MGSALHPDEHARAETLRLEGRYADAERLIRRYLRQHGASPKDDGYAALRLGQSLLLQGHLSDALACFSELYAAAASDPEHVDLAVQALGYQVNALQRLQDGDPPEQRAANVLQQTRLIQDGLRWLEHRGRWDQRCSLLLHLALTRLAAGQSREALDVAEEALRVTRNPRRQYRYTLCDHHVVVARCARSAGNVARSLEVLGDMGACIHGQTDTVRAAIEHARTFRVVEPPRAMEALEHARRAARTARTMQAPREDLLAHEELALCAVAMDSFAEAKQALLRIYQTAVTNESEDGRFLRRRAAACLEGMAAALPTRSSAGANDLQEDVERLLAAIMDQGLEVAGRRS